MNTQQAFLLSLTLFVFFKCEIYGQQGENITQEWVARYNGPGNGFDQAKSVVIDGSGNVFVAGESLGSGTGSDFATVRYNSTGVQQWVRRYNGQGNGNDYIGSIAADGSGNIYVTGWSKSSRFDVDITTIKYDPAGVEKWVSVYNSPDSVDDISYSITIDFIGNVYVTGQTFLDYITIKYNSFGVQQWVRIYDGPGFYVDESYSIVSDVSGNTYVTGFSFGNGNFDYATLKYNSAGVRQWVSRYNGPGDITDNARSVKTDGSGNVYVTGHSMGSGTNYDYATIKYNSSGIQQWVQRYNGPGNNIDNANSIIVDVSGNVYVTGHSRNGTGPETGDYATVKYNSSGMQQWAARYIGSGNGVDSAYSIAVDGSGNVFVTGRSYGSGTLNDYATIRYNSSGVETGVQRYNGPGNSNDHSHSIVVDAAGNVYVTGESAGIGTGSDFATIKYSQTNLTPSLQLNAFIEGFYDPASDFMSEDTVYIYLRNDVPPYDEIDSAKGVLNSSGAAIFSFSNAVNDVPYFIIVKHRNSIETWSKPGNIFVSGYLTYNFSLSAGNAFGSNQLQIDQSPLRFGIYSGDVNQDGIVDGADQSLIDNDIFSFASGYLTTDLTGDDIIDASDAAIADNNAFNFISKITP